MKSYKKVLSLFLIFTLIFSLSSCTFPVKNTQTQEKDREAFDVLCDEIFKDIVSSDTVTLHFTISYPENYGITDYPITIGSFSEEEFNEYEAKEADWFSRLKAINMSFLEESDQLTYKILYYNFSTDEEYSGLDLYYEPLSSVYGEHLNIPILFAEYAFNTEEDIDNYLALLGTVDDYCQEIIDFETRKSQAGLFMADFTADEIIKQCQDFISDPENNYLIDLFNERIDSFEGLTDEEKSTLKEQNRTLVLNDVVNAYNILINGIQSLKGTGVNDGGVCNFEDGRKYFEYLLKSEVGTSKSVEEVKNMISGKMDADINELSYLASANPDIFDEMDNLDLGTDDYEGTLSNLSSFMLVSFPKGPDINYTVKTVHESMRDSLSPAFYLIPTIDKFDKNVIYVNGETDIQTLAHEGYPGHMYQNTYFASTEPDNIRFLFDVTGYSEGWATYVEMYSYHLSGIDDNLATAMEANLSYTLGVYSLVDIGVNYEGWTRQETYDYLTEIGINSIEDQKEIFEIMLGSPGNYLNYYVGYLEILQLKKQANESDKDFNTFLLETGPAPFEIISDLLN